MAESGDQKLSGGVEGEREEEGEGGGGEGRQEEGRKKSEEEVYTLLFREVDSGGEGVVSVRSLVDYLQQMQLGTPQTRLAGAEEVYDSHEDVQQVQYNLQLLKAMLEEVSGSDGVVDLATYSHVIRLWVRDVRNRSNRQPSLEVSHISSDSEDNDDEVTMETPRTQPFEGDQSFETSGGNSSTHSGFERLDLLSSLEDMRQENRRLMEKERQLTASLEVSEEQLRLLHSDHSSLLRQLQGVQQQLTRLENMERDNEAIGQSLKEEEVKYKGLAAAAQEMSKQLTEAQEEVVGLRQRVSETEGLRERGQERLSELQQQLQAREEVLEQERERRNELQSQLSNLRATQEGLRSKVTNLEESNVMLLRENEELHSAAVPPGPSYSTPSRSIAPPSLHEELSRHGNLSGPTLSPLVEIDHRHSNNRETYQEEKSDPLLSRSLGNLSMDDLEHLAQSSSNKFHSKTEVIVRLLSELMNTSHPLHPTSSSTPNPSHSSESITELSHKRLQRSGNMRQLIACVKKLYSEKKQLKAEVEELRAQLVVKGREEVDAAVQTIPPTTETTPTETTPTAVILQTSSSPPCFLSGCTRLVGGVARGVVWLLCMSLLLLLILTVFLWLHEQLSPCCHGNLTPGGMVWALMEPHITITHSGHL